MDLSSADTGNFRRVQEMSSREPLKRLQRENNMARSCIDYRMLDAYMSELQQASREKHELDMPNSPISVKRFLHIPRDIRRQARAPLTYCMNLR